MPFASSLYLCYLVLLSLVATCYAADPFYSIWPVQPLNVVQPDGSSNNAITDALKADLNNDAKKLYISQSETLESTWYWYAELSAELVTKYNKFPGVKKVIVPDNRSGSFRATPTRRDTVEMSSFTTDAAAPDQLKILSLPPGSPLSASPGYVYDSHAGEGINIYVIDSGLTPESPEFKSRTVSWLFAGPFAAEDKTDSDVGEPGVLPNAQGHGTCMASIAMGNKDGVARKASLTVVRSDIFSNNNADLAAEIWIDGLSKVYEDVVKNKLKSKAVVSMSIGLTANKDSTYTQCFTTAMKLLLLALENNQDVPATATVPNDGVEMAIYPALLIKPTEKDKDGNPVAPVPNLIVVSGALTDGDFETDIRDPEIKIYGPADDQAGGGLANPGLECASLDGKGYHRGERGISHATAAVAGMVAYFMGNGNTGVQARQALYDTAQVRMKNGPPMPWNNT